MTSKPDPQFSRRILFEQALDGLQPRQSDVILVLRNHDKDENAARIELGTELLTNCWAPVMMLLKEDNTKAEAYQMINLMAALSWDKVLLVTHRYHSYRAYLTFLKL